MLTSCLATIILNISKESWNKEDKQSLLIAKKRCSSLYVNSPCLKKFIKVEANTYRAICGDFK